MRLGAFLCVAALACAVASSNVDPLTKIFPDAKYPEYFGSSIAINGNTVVVGAPGMEVGGLQNHGGAYVYSCEDPSACELVSKLVVTGGSQSDRFGDESGVAVSGNTVFVASPVKNSDVNPSEGAVFVFHCSGSGNSTSCVQSQHIKDHTGNANEMFGSSIAVSGTMLVVGAPRKTGSDMLQAGSAFVYSCPPDAQCTLLHQIMGSNRGSDSRDRFGSYVAISGSTVVIGAQEKTIESQNYRGAAFVFRCTETECTERRMLTATNGLSSEMFGAPVAVSGDLVAVAARNRRVSPGGPTGSVYIFNCGAELDCAQQLRIDNPGSAAEKFGQAVAMTGTKLFIGSPGDHTETSPSRLYMYTCSSQTGCTNQFTYESYFDGFGFAAATTATIAAVGARFDTNLMGAAYVASTLVPTTPVPTTPAPTTPAPTTPAPTEPLPCPGPNTAVNAITGTALALGGALVGGLITWLAISQMEKRAAKEKFASEDMKPLNAAKEPLLA